MAEIGKDLEKVIQILKNGDLVAIPTETVYGLAANAFNPNAVKKIFEVKGRPTFNPLIIHSDSLEKIEDFVDDIPEIAKKLIDKFSPGALTYVFNKKESVPDIVTGGKRTVAVRIPNHKLTLELLSKLEFPLSAPSANPFGFISPTNPYHVEEQLGDKINYILDGGECNIGLESTIISFLSEKPEILRFGGVSIENIEKIIGKVNIKVNILNEFPDAPGQLKSHYSPNHKLILGNIEELIKEYKFEKEKIGIITFNKTINSIPIQNQRQLSVNSDLEEAASKLFKAMRELDKLDIDIIFAENFPDIEIGKAINDRLKRASN